MDLLGNWIKTKSEKHVLVIIGRYKNLKRDVRMAKITARKDVLLLKPQPPWTISMKKILHRTQAKTNHCTTNKLGCSY